MYRPWSLRIALTIGTVTTFLCAPALASTPVDDLGLTGAELVVSDSSIDIVADDENILHLSADASTSVYSRQQLNSTPTVVYAQTHALTAANVSLPILGYATSSIGVDLIWPDGVGRIGKYEVSRDGVVLTKTNDTSYLDSTGSTDVAYNYVVTYTTTHDYMPPDTTVAAEEVVSDADGFGSINVPDPGRSDPTDPLPVVMSVSVAKIAPGVTAADDYYDQRVAEMAATDKSYFVHRSFINTSTAPGFPCTFPGYYFGGDNRSYSPTSANYRTSLTATMFWLYPNISQTKSVHDTKKYTSGGTLAETRNAGTGKMNIYKDAISSTVADFHASHVVGNPFCATGAITYEWDATVSRSGAYAVYGYHRAAPHHEIYTRAEGAAWRTVYLEPNHGFQCLVIYVCKDFYIP